MIENGRVIAEGTSDELKAQVGGERLEIRLDDPAESAAALTALEPSPTASRGRGLDRARPAAARRGAVADAVRGLDEAGVGIDDIGVAPADARRRVPDTHRAQGRGGGSGAGGEP